MVNKVVSMMCAMLVEYLNALAQQLKSPSLNDKQVLAILVNCRVAVHRLLPNVLGLFYVPTRLAHTTITKNAFG